MKVFLRRLRNSPYLINFHMNRLAGIIYEKKSKKYSELSAHSNEIAHTLYSKHHGLPLAVQPELPEPPEPPLSSPYSELIKSNIRFKDIHKGKRCFVLGNGPSLRNQDLSLLADEITFTVNNIAYMDAFESIRTNYHFWADPLFFESITDEEAEAEKIAIMKRIALSRDDLECFVPTWFHESVTNTGLDKVLKINYFDASSSEMPPVRTDFCDKVSIVQTVIHGAVYLAMYMGFSEIYLLGCESTGIIPIIKVWLNEDIAEDACEDGKNSIYAYDISKNVKKTFNIIKDNYKIEDQFRGHYIIFRNYRLIEEHCKENNIYLCNCTQGGILDVLPREKYEDVISRKMITSNNYA